MTDTRPMHTNNPWPATPMQRGETRRSGSAAFAFVVSIFVAALAGCGAPSSDPPATAPATPVADETGQTTPEPVAPEPGPKQEVSVSGETLLAVPPPKWTESFAMNRNGLRMNEYSPPVEEPIETVKFESIREDPVSDPIDFLLGLVETRRPGCEHFEDYNTFSGYENGYPTSVRLLVCARDNATDKASVMLIKAIAGDENFYSVTWTRQADPVEEGENVVPELEIATWSRYLSGISVCNSTDSAHPCPEASPG